MEENIPYLFNYTKFCAITCGPLYERSKCPQSIISLWVDDTLIVSKTEAHLMQIKTRLNSRFKMTDLRKLSWFLGTWFDCKNNTIKMNLSRYIEKFRMADYKPCSTSGKIDITKTSNKVDLIERKPYREIIGSLIYIMVATRPDICYRVNRLSQDLAKPNSFHLMKAKHSLRYLKGTINHSLIFKKLQKPLKLEGFCDLDWGNLGDRKSLSGFCFRLAEYNPMISWKCKKQNSVIFSTCEAEFIAIPLASQEALYLKKIIYIFYFNMYFFWRWKISSYTHQTGVCGLFGERAYKVLAVYRLLANIYRLPDQQKT